MQSAGTLNHPHESKLEWIIRKQNRLGCFRIFKTYIVIGIGNYNSIFFTKNFTSHNKFLRSILYNKQSNNAMYGAFCFIEKTKIAAGIRYRPYVEYPDDYFR